MYIEMVPCLMTVLGKLPQALGARLVLSAELHRRQFGFAKGPGQNLAKH
jgi:hypothetical protein